MRAFFRPIGMTNSARKSFLLLFFFCTLVLPDDCRGEVKRDVSVREHFKSEQKYNGRTFQNAVPNFSNLTIYLSFLDDIYSHLSSSPNTSEKCRIDTSLLLEKANEGNHNALKILDSVGKPSSGILEGGTSFIGFYSECVTSFIDVSRTEKITGQYCLISVNLTGSVRHETIPEASWFVLMKKSPSIGICVPSSCSESDIKSTMFLSLTDNFEGAEILEDQLTCHANPSGFSKDVGALCILSVLIIFLFIAIAATATDIILSKNQCLANGNNNAADNAISVSREALCDINIESKPTKKKILLDCLLAFSMTRNAKKIFTVESGGEKTRCVHGLKFLSMALIILGHTFSFATTNLFFRNPGAAVQAPKDFLSQIFANGTLAVDTFYFISGLLVAYVTLKVLKKTEGKFPFVYFYLHRYFRLTPLMMMVVLISAFLVRYCGSGPKWLASIVMYDDWCKQNYWTNLIYLNNFINTEHMCLSHTWYLATDMQFYLIVPFILIPLYRWSFKFGVIPASLILLTAIETTAVLTMKYHYPAIPYINDMVPESVVNSYYKNVYIKPYCRIGPYIIGILVGYMLLQNKELKLKKLTATLIWMLSVALGLFIIYIMWPANQGHLPTVAEAAAYSSLARIFWAVTIGWLVVACYYGYGGFVNSILSWTPLVPLSRLTYCAYLIHPVIMNMFYGSMQNVFDYSPSFMIYLFLGNLCITFVVSIILCLMFESPFVALEKVIFSRKSS